MGAQASGKGRRMPQPNQGLGQTFGDASTQQYGGYGTGKSRQPTGPSQFAGGTSPPRQGLETPDLSGIGRYMPPGVSLPPGEAKPTPTAPPVRGGPVTETNPLARALTTGAGSGVSLPPGELKPDTVPVAPPPRGGPVIETNPIARANTGMPTLSAPTPSAAAATPPATPYNTTQGVPAAYGVTPQQGSGAYDLAPNGQANWQANWQAASAAAPTAAAPFGTDDYGNAFTSAAQADDWRQRVAARAAALSGYTFADQARDRGY